MAYLTERTVLIETLWNVNKIPAEIFRIPPAIVLIETLWNVKKAVSASVTISDVVLIETLWNVKKLYRMIKKRKVSLYKEERNYGR